MMNIEQTLVKKQQKIEPIPQPLLFPFFSSIRKKIYEYDIKHFLIKHQKSESFFFIDTLLNYFNFSYDVSLSNLKNIPSSGAILIIANKPLGILDTLSLVHLVKNIRNDIKIVNNSLLEELEQLKPILLAKNNVKELHKSIKKEEAIIIFPSKESIESKKISLKKEIWEKEFLKVAMKDSVPILPIYMKRKKSKFFYTLSIINKIFSSVILNKNDVLKFNIGEIIPHKSFSENPLKINAKVKLLKKHLCRIAEKKKGLFLTEKNIAEPENRQKLKKELKNSELLGETSDGKKIYLYEYKKDSILIHEIARLREYSRRKVDEGTGNKRDKESYDYFHKHLVLWDSKALEIIGSYRIAESNHIYANFDLEGFSTYNIFKFQADFFPYLNNSIELSKGFIQPKYWNKNSNNYLLESLQAYLIQNQHIKYIFGSIGLSSNIPKELQELILYYYEKYHQREKSPLQANNPFILQKERKKSLSLIFSGDNKSEDFKILTEQLSFYGISIPPLYKQYNKMSGEKGLSIMEVNIPKEVNKPLESFILIEVDKSNILKKEKYFRKGSTIK